MPVHSPSRRRQSSLGFSVPSKDLRKSLYKKLPKSLRTPQACRALLKLASAAIGETERGKSYLDDAVPNTIKALGKKLTAENLDIVADIAVNTRNVGHNVFLTVDPAMTAVIKALDAKNAVNPEALRLVAGIADIIIKSGEPDVACVLMPGLSRLINSFKSDSVIEKLQIAKFNVATAANHGVCLQSFLIELSKGAGSDATLQKLPKYQR